MTTAPQTRGPLLVSASSSVRGVANALEARLREEGNPVSLRAIGVNAVNQMVKAVITASQMVQRNEPGRDLYLRASFTSVPGQGESEDGRPVPTSSAVVFEVVKA